MAFKIREAFDLLFTLDGEDLIHAREIGPVYDDRRWFRSPRAYDLGEDLTAKAELDAGQAEMVLIQKIQDVLPSWREQLKADVIAGERISEARPNLKAKLHLRLDSRRHLPPRSPYDVFAIAAFLIDAAGVYHHIQPEKRPVETAHCAYTADAHGRESARHLSISSAERRTARKAARAWREIPLEVLDGSAVDLANHIVSEAAWPDLEPLFESWLVVFQAYADADIFLRLSSRRERAEPHPGWWRHVYRLLAIADEAAQGTAFNFDAAHLLEYLKGDSPLQWFEAEYFFEFAETIRRKGGGARATMATIDSLSVARSEILGVLPKVRTPAVGCTLRSLSHHLAVTPSHGVARGRWIPSFERNLERVGQVASGQMNVLLIPLPFTIEAKAFCGALSEDRSDTASEQNPVSSTRYGYFDLHQHWLKPPGGWDESAKPWLEEILQFVRALIAAARAHSPRIDAVIFPELSLDHVVFERIRDMLEEEHSDIELVVAGLSSKPYREVAPPPNQSPASTPEAAAVSPAPPVTEARHGNFVAVASFNRGAGAEKRRVSIREKHHRWKLDRNQLRDYGLLGVLSPELDWWENIALQSRRVDFTVIRDRAVLSAMICEDLARVDPCQQVIRSVGPNLVVALLMDAPQHGRRWPGRYATVLAEDPGCAVLTVTSRGLMARQHRLGLFPSNGADRIIGLWRDDRSAGSVELNCPYDAQGLILTIVEETAEDVSLDGRVDKSAIAMRYAGHTPVRLPAGGKDFRHVLGDEQNAC